MDCVIDDPPYYLPNTTKKSNLPSISRYSRLNKIYPNRSSRAGMKRLHPAGSIALIDSTEESNSDSFRSVIDDLTIKSIPLPSYYLTLTINANRFTDQKLKKRLKKLEGLHGGGLAEEKLFEVRMHGLSLYDPPPYDYFIRLTSGADKKNRNLNVCYRDLLLPWILTMFRHRPPRSHQKFS